jgi:hypothetical protein
LAKSALNKQDKERELKKYLSLNLATLDYYLEHKVIKVKTEDFDSDIYFRSLKTQTQEHFDKGKLARLKQWFRDLTEPVKEDSTFTQYLKNKTGLDIDLKNQFKRRIERIIKKSSIKNENEYRDIMEKIDDVCQSEPVDKMLIDLLNSLLLDFETRHHEKRK